MCCLAITLSVRDLGFHLHGRTRRDGQLRTKTLATSGMEATKHAPPTSAVLGNHVGTNNKNFAAACIPEQLVSSVTLTARKCKKQREVNLTEPLQHGDNAAFTLLFRAPPFLREQYFRTLLLPCRALNKYQD